MLSHPHDHLVRAVFGDPARAAALLRSVLPGTLLESLDLATLVAVPTGFIDGALRDHAADLLFTARWQGDETLLVHLLIEHQSRVDRWMALRLIEYQLRIWERWRRNHPEVNALPRIVPVVLYHGDQPWPHPTRFADLIEGRRRDRSVLLEGALDFQWWLDDLTRYSDEALRARALDAASQLTLLALKHARSPAQLGERVLAWVDLMNGAARTPGGRELLFLVLRYLVVVNDAIGHDFLCRELAPRLDDPLAKETAMTWGERMLAQGEEIGQRRLLLRLLERRFGALPAAAIEQVEAAPSEQIEVWALRILDARSLSEALAEA